LYCKSSGCNRPLMAALAESSQLTSGLIKPARHQLRHPRLLPPPPRAPRVLPRSLAATRTPPPRRQRAQQRHQARRIRPSGYHLEPSIITCMYCSNVSSSWHSCTLAPRTYEVMPCSLKQLFERAHHKSSIHPSNHMCVSYVCMYVCLFSACLVSSLCALSLSLSLVLLMKQPAEAPQCHASYAIYQQQI